MVGLFAFLMPAMLQRNI